MGVETGPALLTSLNSSWPLSSDQRRFGAAHLRFLKACVKGQFPNLTAAIAATSAEINQLVGFNTAAINAVTLSGQTSAFYRDATNINAGVLEDARVQSSNVTQHQASLAIGSHQISPGVQTKNASFSVDATMDEDIVICDSASAMVVTLIGGVVGTGHSIGFIRRGTGSVTFAAGAGQTVNKPAGLAILLQHGKAVATYIATNVWELGGNL